MNNLEWYSEVIRFCQLSTSCARCPYHLLGGPVALPQGDEKPCFVSADTLELLSSWLKEQQDYPLEVAIDEESDHRWLRELLETQFAQDDDDDDLFLDEELF